MDGFFLTKEGKGWLETHKPLKNKYEDVQINIPNGCNYSF